MGVGGAPRLRGRAVEVRARRDRHRFTLLDPAAAAREVGRAARRRDVERVLIEHDLAVDDPQLRRERRRRRRRRLDLRRLRRHRRQRRRPRASSPPRSPTPPRSRRRRRREELHQRARGDRGGVVGEAPPAIEWVSEASSAGAPTSSAAGAHVLVLQRLALGWFITGGRPASWRPAGAAGYAAAACARRRLHRHADRALHHDLAHRHVLDRHPRCAAPPSAAFRDVARAPSGPRTVRPLAGVRRSMRHPGNSGPASSWVTVSATGSASGAAAAGAATSSAAALGRAPRERRAGASAAAGAAAGRLRLDIFARSAEAVHASVVFLRAPGRFVHRHGRVGLSLHRLWSTARARTAGTLMIF